MDHENMARPALALMERERRFYDVQVWASHGPIASIVYARICYWVAKNLAEGRNVDEDGVAWTYDSAQEMADKLIFPSLQQVQRALQALKKDGLIISKPDPNRWERTLWYSLPDASWHQICHVETINPDTSRHITGDTSTYTGVYVNKDTRKDTRDRHKERTHTHLASLGDAPTSSSPCVSLGVSSIGDGKVGHNSCVEGSAVHAAELHESHGIKTPPPTPPPLKTRKTPLPVDVKNSRVERAPLVFTSDSEHASLLSKCSPEVLALAYEELSEWKRSKEEVDPKAAKAHTDYHRLKRWGIKAAMEALLPKRGSGIVPRKGHIQADEIAQKEMEKRTGGLNEKVATIVEERLSLEECLKSHRANGWLTLEDIRQAFPDYTGDGS
jgi:hypothetical protein